MTYLAKAKKSGAKVVVVDVYRTGTAEQADIFVPVRPGTDSALAAAMINVILEEGLADRDYLAQLTDWDERVEAHFAGKTPAWAAEITGVPAEKIVEVARLFGSTKKAYIRVGYGFARGRGGAASVHAVSCLPTVTGAWKEKGGGALWGHGQIYHLDQTLIEGLDALDPSVRVLDMSRMGPVLVGDKADIGDGPPVMGLLIQNMNPAVVCPETAKVLDGFNREDLFTVVHEQFLTETAALADIVLPATMFLEHDDFYTASGHTFLQVARKVLEPAGEARENHFVHCELARRLGAEHPGFEMTVWEIIEETFRLSGHPPPAEMHAALGEDCARPFEEAHFLKGFPQPDGKFHFTAQWSAIGAESDGLPALPDDAGAILDEATPARPFRLVAAPARAYLNTSFTETPGSQKREGRPEVMMHPEDCEKLGLRDGDRVRMGNDLGSLLIHVRPFDGLQRGVVIVESVHPNKTFIEGVGINVLISADRGKPRGGAVFHDTAVWIERA
jgi:anaerobic selenocysteine-containing dehydrogenase